MEDAIQERETWCEKCNRNHTEQFCTRCKVFHSYHPTYEEVYQDTVQRMVKELNEEIDRKVIEEITRAVETPEELYDHVKALPPKEIDAWKMFDLVTREDSKLFVERVK
jgi:hypothetical protein